MRDELQSAEVLIAGAGLAGASAACVLAQAGRPVLLVERDKATGHKVCGEFLSIEAQAYLAHLGVDLDRLGASRLTSVRLVRGRMMAEVDLPFTARGLSRKSLDEALLQAAASRGARIVRGASIRAVSAEGSSLRVDAGGLGIARAQTVFLATGKHDVRGAKRPPAGSRDDMIGFKAHYALADRQRSALDGAIEVALFTGGYAGLQMIDGGVANLCLVVTRGCFEQAGKSWPMLLERIGQECPHLRDRLEGAVALHDRPLSIFQIPYGFIHEPPRAEPQGLFRLGDQFGVIPSYTGEGMSIALHSGCLAASTYLAHGRASFMFHQQLRADVQRQIQLSSFVYAAAHKPLGQQALLRLCQAWPTAMRFVASMTRVREAAMQRVLLAS
jgi:flavin-dependent dehydrogenase